MATEINLERNSGIVTAGTHLFKIAGFSEEMGGSGYPYWKFDCICQTAGEDQGKKVMAMVSLSPSARWKLDQFLDSMAMPQKGRAKGEDFVGKTFRGVISHEVYEGTTRAKIDGYIPVAPAPGKTETSTATEKAADQQPPAYKPPF